MPELPEVETLKRELSKVLPGRQIKKTEILWWKTVSPLSPEEFAEQTIGKKIAGVNRRAKMLFIDLADSTALAIHLKMTGQLIFEPPKGRAVGGGHPDQALNKKQPTKHTRLIFTFKDGSKLFFNDLRKFGWVRLMNDSQIKKLTAPIGLEPLSKIFTDQALLGIFHRYPNRTIKQTLLDQSLVAGLGNIYVDESLYLAGIRPDRSAGSLKKSEIQALYQAINQVINKAIKYRGTTFNNYVDSAGRKGNFSRLLHVYGRAKQACFKCGTPIQKKKLAGRGTHYCPHCQK